MFKIFLSLASFLSIIPLIYTQPIEDNTGDTNGTASNPKYGVLFHIYGLIFIILSSGIGTILPILLKNKSFFSVKSPLFNSLKMFGTGVIVTVAFVHMLSPADKMLSGDDAPEFFRENYDAFSGVFAVTGIIVAHGIQLLLKEFFKNQNKNHIHNEHNEYTSKTNIIVHNGSNSTESDSLLSSSGTVSYNYNTYSNNKDDYDEVNHEGCGHEALLLVSHKQMVSYLLEIGISLHSVLIGFAFGTNFDDDINYLLIALMIHQFFEGIALSTIFIEAKFKNMIAPILMVIFYSITMPLGGVGGLLIYSINSSNTTIMTSIQGILDSIAAGLLIYDSLVNILSHYTSSKHWDETGKYSKIVQIFSFYLGCVCMALIGIWA
ncbi:Zinc/iron permease [Neocallimastix lanati (nom. inval.)]|jgi:zinc transporter 1/2/3|nr:Zinc/iron permease [Neocallimastix sp. JGI-2020a]